jgi:hypothetical protein
VNVTQQQAVPYQFAQGLFAVGTHDITWPDQFEGLITGVSLVAQSTLTQPLLLVADASGVNYTALAGVQQPTTGLWVAESQPFQVVPSGSALELVVVGNGATLAVSGWLLNPPGSVILAE